MTFPKDILDLASELVALCTEKKIIAATAESCTGGLVAAAITEIPGASECLKGGFVSYSDDMKTRMLGVSVQTLEAAGAVSEEVAREMAKGALKAASADFGVAITGIAGPGGGSPEKPVGLVHFASARRAGGAIHTHHERHYLKERGRAAIRLGAVRIALGLLIREAKHY
ncbi:MAG: nicotinamide-nucleotide amidohydrolase family protein [Proteobacteria bacterium]|nr:nicotinamide-nucleotide amidohydrolase family protein [Pseudomonadota bacterium]